METVKENSKKQNLNKIVSLLNIAFCILVVTAEILSFGIINLTFSGLTESAKLLIFATGAKTIEKVAMYGMMTFSIFSFIYAIQNFKKKSLFCTYLIQGILFIVCSPIISKSSMDGLLWIITLLGANIVSIVQLFIIHKIEKSGTEKMDITNNSQASKILYYVVMPVVAIGIIVAVRSVPLHFSNKISKAQKQIEIFNNRVMKVNMATDAEILLKARNNNKYGYINLSGKEVIPCQFDMATHFLDEKIQGKDYYFAVVKEKGKYFIEFKDGSKIDFSDLDLFFDKDWGINNGIRLSGDEKEKDINKDYYFSGKVMQFLGLGKMDVRVQKADDEENRGDTYNIIYNNYTFYIVNQHNNKVALYDINLNKLSTDYDYLYHYGPKSWLDIIKE